MSGTTEPCAATVPSWVRRAGLDRPVRGPFVLASFALLLFHCTVALTRPDYWSRVPVWDERYYVEIARYGYLLLEGDYTRFTRLPFAPLWPAVLRGTAWLTGLDPAVVRLPLSAMLFLATCQLFGWTMRAFSLHHLRNNLALLCFVCWPGSIYFMGSYAECLYMPLMLGAFGFMLRRQWLPAAACTALCWFTRTPAIVVAATLGVAILLDGWQRGGWRSVSRAVAMAAACGGISALGLVAYMSVTRDATGDWFSFQRSYVAWELCEIRNLRSLTFRPAADVLMLFPDRPTVRLSLAWALLVPLIVWAQRRTMPPVLTVYCAGAWLFYQFNDWLLIPYHDMLRWLAVLFPVSFAIVTFIQVRGPRTRILLGACWLAASLAAWFWCAQRYVAQEWVS